MKVLVLGPNGMLGRALVRYFDVDNRISVVSVSRKEIDLSNCTLHQLSDVICNINPNFIVNCAGIIKQRNKASSYEIIQLNTLIPLWLEQISKDLNCKFIHFTTDCVYDGREGGYHEKSWHSARDMYGMSKSLGEPRESITIRSSIIGEESSNKLSLLDVVRNHAGKKMFGYTNHIWNGMTCLQAAKLIKNIMFEPKLQYLGTRHFYSNSISKFELISIINDVYSLEIDVVPHEDKQAVNRTLTSIYENGKMKASIEDQVREQMLFWKSY